METSALRPRILALQVKGTASVRQAGGLRPARVASVFSGRRTCLPRNRLAASVAAADVEAPEVASAEQTNPAPGSRPAGAGTNGGTRRREGGPRRQRRLETKYKVEDLVVGQEVDGVVGSATAFGAFVDIGMGSKDALLHISHMADGFVSDIAEHVQVGMQIKARVINVDPGTSKVGLTMRSPESEEARVERQARRAERSERFGGGGERGELGERGQAPVQARMRRAPKERKDIKFPAVGEEIQGSVEGVQNYGVFVKISDDIKAMLHGSEMATKDGREPDIRATFSIGDAIKVRVLKVDAKNRRVDVTQRSEEEIEADRTLNEKGASTARVSGMNTLQAALARAGIRKQDFEDLSKAPEESSTAEPSPAAAPAADMSPEAAAVEAEPAAEPSPVADAEPEVTAAQEPAIEPEEEVPAPAEEAKPQAAAAAGAEVISPPMEGIAAPTGDNAAPVLDEPQGVPEPTSSDTAPVAEEAALQPEPAAAPAVAEATPEVAEPEVAAEVPAAPEAMPEPSQPEAAPAAEEPLQASAAPEEPKEELSLEAFPAAEAASSSATAGVEAAPADPETSEETSSTEAVPAASTASEPAPTAFKVDAKAAKALRDQTGAGMMDAKKALMETGGDAAAAVEWLRKKGLSGADKKAGRIASEGVIASYIHAGSRLGVLVELNCETDFVARGDKFKELVSDMAMQIAASGEVTVISVDDVPADVKQKEFDIEMGKEDIQSKPENIRPKIVEGRVAKTFKTMALLEQAFIKDTDKDVASVIKEATAALGEKIQVRRFEKFVLGEGIEKKTNDLAKEVEAQTKAMEEAAKKAAAPADSAASPSEAAAEPAQVKIDAKAVKQLRQASGAGMMDAKKALIETGGDVDKAMEFLRKKGLASADKKAGRLASEGAIGAYIHAGSRLGVLVEVNCETDFVARGPQFKELVQDMAMQIAASAGVDIVAIEDAPQEELERERAIEMQKEDIQAKPENIRGKIVDGRVQKIFKERALLEQAFIKDTSKTVAEHIKAQVATIGENIQVRRFARFVLGEGIEKKQENFAEEIAAATGQS